MMKKWIVLIVWALMATSGSAKDVRINASAPEVVTLGRQFRLIFEINTREGKFMPPDMSDFAILMGPSTSYSQSTQIINGRMSTSVSYTYTYILQAKQTGEYIIGPAKLKIKNQIIESNSLKIKVVKGSNPPSSQGAASPSGQGTTPAVKGIPNTNLFVKVLVDKTHVFQGEAVVATVKIYSRVNLSGFEEVDMPEFDGFLKQEIPTPNLTSLQREYINGQAYGTGILGRSLLFPQTTGDIKIDPVKIICLVRERVHASPGGFFDDFFDTYQTVRKPILSNRVTIHVDPLPPGAPSTFRGTVGIFGLDASLDKTVLKVNDAVTLKVKISGNGNLKLIQSPKIEFPPDFETYDPKISSVIKNTVHGATGYKQFEYLMIPRHAGKYRIPSVVLSYFDPSSRSYKTLRTPAFNLNVQKGKETENTQMITGGTKEELKYIGKDIRYIYNKHINLKPADYTFFGTWTFYLVFIVSLALFFIIYIVYRQWLKTQNNVQLIRNRQANKIARKRLKTAGQYLNRGEKGRFYEEVLKAVWGYLSDKLLLPLSDLTRETAGQALEQHGIDKDVIERLMRTIDQCEFAQYAPESAEGPMDKLYEDTVNILSELEQKL